MLLVIIFVFLFITCKKRYNLTSTRNLADVLNLVANSNTELSHDEKEDTAEPATSGKVRIGAFKVRPLDHGIIGPDVDDSDAETDLPLLLLKENDGEGIVKNLSHQK